VTVNATTQLGAFSVSRSAALLIRHAVPIDEAGQLQWIDRRTGAATNVGGVRPYYERTVSPDGRSIAATIADAKTGSSDIWILGSGGTERRLTSSREYESAPVWSPDGTRIAYTTTLADGSSAVHVRQVEGGEPIVLREWREPGLLLPQSWSADERHLMVCRVSVPGRAPDLLTWSFETKTLTPYLESSAMECWAQFSPDGRYVAYVSTEAGPVETWVARFPVAAEKWRVATGAGVVSWRADGRELLITTAAPDVAALPLTITPDRVLAGSPTTLVRRLDQISVAATRDHSRLLVLSRPDPEQGVAEIQLVTAWLNKLR
jgi:serine/threonine-protein kinase